MPGWTAMGSDRRMTATTPIVARLPRDSPTAPVTQLSSRNRLSKIYKPNLKVGAFLVARNLRRRLKLFPES
jgi:hypothetical protein